MVLWAWSSSVLVTGIWGSARTTYQPALVGRGKARCHMDKSHRYVSSPPPFRTVLEAFTSHGCWVGSWRVAILVRFHKPPVWNRTCHFHGIRLDTFDQSQWFSTKRLFAFLQL